MTIFACNPEDYEQLPWVEGCVQCAQLRDDPQPGLSQWVFAVGDHFDGAHGVFLTGK